MGQILDTGDGPPLTEVEVLMVLDEAPGPLTSTQIAQRLGIANERGVWLRARGRRSCRNAQWLLETLQALRSHGCAVKLPTENSRNGAQYVRCRDHAHARRLQLAATERALREAEERRRGSTRIAMLREALIGLRQQVSLAEPAPGVTSEV